MTAQATPQLTTAQVANLGRVLGAAPQRIDYLASGCNNDVFRVHLDGGSLVLKASKGAANPDLFALEAHALEHLARTGTVHVPQVRLATSEFLVMEDLGEDRKEISDDQWTAFGAQVGRLHQVRADRYGYEHDNYIGNYHQRNTATDDWVDFYYRHRVQCYLDLGHNKRVLTTADREGIERTFDRMRSLIPRQEPGLCHGDFFMGNTVRKADGTVYVIDPALHFGLPEADLAMTQMYDVFPDAFYCGYRSEAELLPDWKERLPLYQLKELVLMVAQFEHQESLQLLRATIARFW